MNEWTDAISGTNIIQEYQVVLTSFICIDFYIVLYCCVISFTEIICTPTIEYNVYISFLIGKCNESPLSNLPIVCFHLTCVRVLEYHTYMYAYVYIQYVADSIWDREYIPAVQI